MYPKIMMIIRYFILAVIFLIPSFAMAEGFDRDLQFGMQNNSDVIKLQQFLTEQGVYSGPVSGGFFSLTHKSIKKFQIREGIKPASGYFGLKTRTRANAILVTNVNESKKQASIENIAPLASVSTTPTKTENVKPNVMSSIMDQIAALQKQLDSLLNKTPAPTANPTPPVQTTIAPNQTPAVIQPTPQITPPTIQLPNSTVNNILPVTTQTTAVHQTQILATQVLSPVVSSPQVPLEVLHIKELSIITKETSAVIQWKTNKITESIVTINKVDENNNATFVSEYKSTGLNHSIEAINLRPNVRYTHSISSKSSENDSAYESARGFIIPPSSRFILNIEWKDPMLSL